MLANKLAKSNNLSSYCHIKATDKIVLSTICNESEPKQLSYRGSWGKTDMWGKTNTNVFYPFRIDKIKNF